MTNAKNIAAIATIVMLVISIAANSIQSARNEALATKANGLQLEKNALVQDTSEYGQAIRDCQARNVELAAQAARQGNRPNRIRGNGNTIIYTPSAAQGAGARIQRGQSR